MQTCAEQATATTCYKHASYIAEGKLCLLKDAAFRKIFNALKCVKLPLSHQSSLSQPLRMLCACAHCCTGKKLNLTNQP